MHTAVSPRTGAHTIHGLLDAAVADAPDATAVSDATGSWTYRELVEHSAGFAAWLCAQGVGKGDRVVARLPSVRELVAMFYGTVRIGAIFVPLNPAMKQFQLTSVLENAEPVLVVTTDPAADGWRSAIGVPVYPLSSVSQERPADVTARCGPDDIAVLIYTSGSTASPKAVIGPHAQVRFASAAIQQVLGYRQDDVVFCRFPLSWDYGLYKVLLCCLGRSELVLAGEESDLMLLQLMRENGTTVVPIVPSLAAMICTLAERDDGPRPPIRLFTNTGAALPAPTIAALRKNFSGARVVRQFGQTECKRVSIMPPDEDDTRPSSVGRPLPGTIVLILDADGNQVPTGEVGEIVVVGPHVMPGYWRLPELTARTFRVDPVTGERRLHTGDYGSVDADGYLYFEGRHDDMFKRKGIRMSTLEIEAAAIDVPGVRRAAALPPTADHDLAIFVETVLAPHVVLKELAQRLEPAKVPGICRVVNDLPLTLHGKYSSEVLAAMLEKKPE